MNKKIIMVSALALAFMLTAIGSGTGDSSSEVASKVGEVSSQESSENNDSVSTDESKTEFVVGDVLKTDKLNITYLSSGDYTSDNQFIQPEENNKYIFLELFCENISDSDINISNASFDCYVDGYACDSINLSNDSLYDTLSSGRSVIGKAYFEIPDNAKEIEIEYEPDFWSNEKVKFIFEGDKQSGITPEVNVSSSENAFKVGDIIESDDFRITYISCGEYITDSKIYKPAEENHFVYFEFEFENISDRDQSIGYYDFDCFADGMSCDSKNLSNDDVLRAKLSPGRKAKGTVIFEVPIDAEIVEAECKLNYWHSDRVIFTYQPE